MITSKPKLYTLPTCINPIIGNPQVIQAELDQLAQDYNKYRRNDDYNRILNYIHWHILSIIKEFWIAGDEADDLYQLCCIALVNDAIPSFDPSKGSSFLTFSKLCMRRRLITELNNCKNTKNAPLHSYCPLDMQIGDKEDDTIESLTEDLNAQQPYDEIIYKEEVLQLKEREINELQLTKMERKVLNEYLINTDFNFIAEKLGLTYKCVDNCLFRIRRKARGTYDKCKELSNRTYKEKRNLYYDEKLREKKRLYYIKNKEKILENRRKNYVKEKRRNRYTKNNNNTPN